MKRTPLKRHLKRFNCNTCGVEVVRPQRGAGLCRRCAQKQNSDASAAAAAERRRLKALPCRYCGQAFNPVARRSFYCSQKCMGLASRKPRTCVECGVEFWVKSSLARKTCSRKCWSALSRKAKLGTRNPAYRNGSAAATRAWYAALEEACGQCGAGGKLHMHHVVYEQHVRRAKGDPYDVRNGLTLCTRCHFRHHHAIDAKISVDILRPANLEFAHELLGDATSLYFTRYYAANGEGAIESALDRAAEKSAA